MNDFRSLNTIMSFLISNILDPPCLIECLTHIRNQRLQKAYQVSYETSQYV